MSRGHVLPCASWGVTWLRLKTNQFGVGAPAILEPSLVGIGMFTRGTFQNSGAPTQKTVDLEGKRPQALEARRSD